MADLVVKGEFGAERQSMDNWHRGIKYNAMCHSVESSYTIGTFSDQQHFSCMMLHIVFCF